VALLGQAGAAENITYQKLASARTQS
jgi:hypothetical protein